MLIDDVCDKNKRIEGIPSWREELRKQGKKLVMTNGCFDILHRGHVTYLIGARELGDALIVAINSDKSVENLKGPNRPLTKEKDRAFILSSLSCIDAVVIFNEMRCDKIIDLIQPDIYVKGADYTIDSMDKDERTSLERINSEIKFISFVDGYSTSLIIKKYHLA